MSPIRVAVAPQSFKDSLENREVASAMEKGVLAVWGDAEIVSVPIADGGDGTLDVLLKASSDSTVESVTTTDALGRVSDARWGTIENGKTAVIETAEANGLVKLKPAERNALITTTYGIGNIFKKALDHGCDKIIVGIGGSATNDGGAGLVQAMGARLLDVNGKEVEPGGVNLSKITTIDLSDFDKRIEKTQILVSSDVNNPLCGPNGASAIFGPQKGARAADVATLDTALAHWADIIKRDLGTDIIGMAGAGAAGGLGAGLVAFFNARLVPGADLILDTIRFNEKIQNTDLVIVGEGRFDHSSIFNKAPIIAAKRAKKFNIPTIGICGSIGEGYEAVNTNGVDAVFSIITNPMTLKDAIKNAAELITQATEQACRSFAAGKMSV